MSDTTSELMTVAGSITSHSSAEQIAEALNRMGAFKERLKEAEQIVEAALMDWISEHGELEIGTVRYYVGPKKTTKCKDGNRTFTVCLDLASGDIEAMVRDFMSSQPWKHGAIRKALEAAGNPGEFDECFTVEEEPELKEGKPTKRVQKVDTRFLR